MDHTITSQDYQYMKGRVEKDLVMIKDKLTDLQKQTSPFKAYIQKELPMLENLLEYYRKSDGATKKKILNTIFAEKLIVINGKVIEPIFMEPIQLILRISGVLRRSEKKKEVDLNQSLLATLTKTRFFKFKSCNPLSESVSVRVSLEEKGTRRRVGRRTKVATRNMIISLLIYSNRFN